MKKMKKIGIVAALFAMTFVSVFALTACGGATLTAGYSSQADFSYYNGKLQNYNYYYITYTFQTLETYSDNTYVFSISQSTFSAIEMNLEKADWSGQDKANFIVRYYGNYSAETHQFDDDTLVITMEKPTRIVAMYDGAYFADTDNWLEEYNSSAKDVHPQGADMADTTRDTFYSKHAFEQTKIEADKLKYSFDYVSSISFTQYPTSGEIEITDVD